MLAISPGLDFYGVWITMNEKKKDALLRRSMGLAAWPALIIYVILVLIDYKHCQVGVPMQRHIESMWIWAIIIGTLWFASSFLAYGALLFHERRRA